MRWIRSDWPVWNQYADVLFDDLTDRIDCVDGCCESNKHTEYELLMPRFDKKDITITGEVKNSNTVITVNAKNDVYNKKKTFYIPFISEKIESKLDLGVLTIKAHRKKSDVNKFQIEVK